ncbi:hypothetical protein ACFYNW_36295 [Streptomyces virginiae]|uniref:hypothetical protein n=1 Tax=Streptomyces virginiae TaxID=1961 RepID=UPI0036E4C371
MPVVERVRRLVLDPPVFRHQYRAGRLLPRVPGSLTLEAVLEPAEAARCFTGVRDLMSGQSGRSGQDASRSGADGY